MTTDMALQKKLARMHGRPSYRTAQSIVSRLRGTTRLSTPPTKRQVVDYQLDRLAAGARPSTVNRELGFLRAACREADLGYPAVRTLRESPRTRVLTRAEWEKLHEFLPGWEKDLATVLIGTGMRVGEALKARPQDIQIEGKLARKTVRITVANPKEGVEKVCIGAASAAHAVERLLLAGNGLLREGSSPPRDYEIFRYSLTRASKIAEIPRVTAHDLRRTFGSWALDCGASLEQVAQCLGHQSVDTTRRCYGRINPKVRTDVARKVLP
jgi:integrase